MNKASNNPPTRPTSPAATAAPWWRHGHVWLVISGPALVVVASFLTLYLAIAHGDKVIDEHYYQGAETEAAGDAKPLALAPAMQARNHAATGVLPAAKR